MLDRVVDDLVATLSHHISDSMRIAWDGSLLELSRVLELDPDVIIDLRATATNGGSEPETVETVAMAVRVALDNVQDWMMVTTRTQWPPDPGGKTVGTVVTIVPCECAEDRLIEAGYASDVRVIWNMMLHT